MKETIEKYWNETDQYNSKLMMLKQRVTHYSIALSDNWLISWIPANSRFACDSGTFKIYPLASDWEVAKWVHYLDKADIKENLMRSIDVFHQKWNYFFFNWNCEHWARLVSTGDPICYQIPDCPIIGTLGVWRRNHYASRQLSERVSEIRLAS